MTNARSAIGNAALYMAGSALGTALVFRFVPPERTGPSTSPLLPPGWVVGSVWTGLFGLLGVARSLLSRHPRERTLLDAFYLFCLSYPIYTNGFRIRAVSFGGNAATMASAVALSRRLNAVSPPAGRLVLPVIAWVAFATLGMATERRQ